MTLPVPTPGVQEVAVEIVVGSTRDTPREVRADQAELARAVAYLAGQSARGHRDELTITRSGDRWLP
jgi:hypothetical protein